MRRIPEEAERASLQVVDDRIGIALERNLHFARTFHDDSLHFWLVRGKGFRRDGERQSAGTHQLQKVALRSRLRLHHHHSLALSIS
jgi:hypothetical protein